MTEEDAKNLAKIPYLQDKIKFLLEKVDAQESELQRFKEHVNALERRTVAIQPDDFYESRFNTDRDRAY